MSLKNKLINSSFILMTVSFLEFLYLVYKWSLNKENIFYLFLILFLGFTTLICVRKFNIHIKNIKKEKE